MSFKGYYNNPTYAGLVDAIPVKEELEVEVVKEDKEEETPEMISLPISTEVKVLTKPLKTGSESTTKNSLHNK